MANFYRFSISFAHVDIETNLFQFEVFGLLDVKLPDEFRFGLREGWFLAVQFPRIVANFNINDAFQ